VTLHCCRTGKLVPSDEALRVEKDRGFMFAYCVNPNCYVPLHSFSEGKLFQFEIVSISIAATDDAISPFDEKPERRTSHFWLCGHCADSLTLVLEPLKGLKVVPLGRGAEEMAELSDVPLSEGEIGHTHSC